MQTFDGSEGEGGGAILRLVSALALITQDKMKIINIRKNRSNPGLQIQHLKGIQALAEFCGGELEGDTLGSETLVFNPSNNWKSLLEISIPTAGSIGLILQTLQIAVLATQNFTLDINFDGGATFGKWAPSIPYIKYVTWQVFQNLGLRFELDIKRHGFFPRGGAQVISRLITPTKINKLNLELFHDPKEINIFSYASHHLKNAQVAERQINPIRQKLENITIKINEKTEYVESINPGSGLLLYSGVDKGVIGADFIGERKLRAENVGLNAYARYINVINSRCVVDPFLADQLLPILALASGSSSFTTHFISKHSQTNINLLQSILNVSIQIENHKSYVKVLIDT